MDQELKDVEEVMEGLIKKVGRYLLAHTIVGNMSGSIHDPQQLLRDLLDQIEN